MMQNKNHDNDELQDYANNQFFSFAFSETHPDYIKGHENDFSKPKFYRKEQIIDFDPNFLTNEYENILNNYEKYFDQLERYDAIDNKCKKFDEFGFNKFNIEWLTISNSIVQINHLYTICKIQLTAKSKLKVLYSIFIPQNLSKTEGAIEIFANSKAIFKNCHFYDSPRVSVIVRNFSSVRFENCVFENNKISCFIMDDSYAEFIDCKFKGDKNISIFVSKDSKCQIEGCEFRNLQGKAVFAKDNSKIYIKNSKFIGCEKGAATICENSSLFLDGQIEISDSQNTAIRAIVNSHIEARDVIIRNANGNAINMENSDGYFFNCKMIGTIHPTIAVIGRNSNPIFYNCNLTDNGETFCVICKNCSSPLFYNCSFSDCQTHCFSVSDFASPHIENCRFENINKYCINAFSGSFVTYNNLISDDLKIHSSPSAQCKPKSLNERMNYDMNKEDNDDEEIYQEQHIRSWRSPTYELPPEIKQMKDPEEIKNGFLKTLKQVSKTDIKSRIGDKDVKFVCSKCHHELNEEDEPNIITPCGHIICNDCCKSNNIDRCPICDSPIKEFKKIFFTDECSICLEKKPNTISLPCGHFCMCYECAMKCKEMNYNCPMCNEPMSSFKYVFADTEIAKNEQNKGTCNKISQCIQKNHDSKEIIDALLVENYDEDENLN